jgi:hypothetical protein
MDDRTCGILGKQLIDRMIATIFIPLSQHTLTVRDVYDVIGGGQLGRMMIEAGNRIGVRIAILDPGILIHCGHHDNIEYLLL